jgi:predicted chitinase
MYLLPPPVEKKSFFKVMKKVIEEIDVMRTLYNLFQIKNDISTKVDRKISKKQIKYTLAAVLDIACIMLILLNVQKPVQRLISPLVNSLQSFQSQAQIKMTDEVFAFAPGLARNKFQTVDFNGLNYLTFFDVLVSEDGELDRETRGYSSFKSDESYELIQKANSYGTKVLLTVTQFDNSEIRNILENSGKTQSLIEDIVYEVSDSGINGVSVDFEYQGEVPKEYKDKFSRFIADLSSKMHQKNSNYLVAVVVPTSAAASSSTGLYDLGALGANSDKVFAMPTNFIVPEFENRNPISPVYAYQHDEYWKDVSKNMMPFARVPKEKLVLERAWYGNGNQYPLYKPSGKPVEETGGVEPSHVLLDSEKVDRLVSEVPSKAREAARRNIPLIGKALEDEGILDSNVLSYALATIEHETDETFEPLHEIQGRFSARRLGYEGGTNYFGRGFIQLTHLRNYRMVGERIGMGDQLARNPELASNPEVSAKILAAFFKDNNVANLASRGQFIAARRPVNPDYNGYKVASLAWKYGEGIGY